MNPALTHAEWPARPEGHPQLASGRPGHAERRSFRPQQQQSDFDLRSVEQQQQHARQQRQVDAEDDL
jgi:hypothetical protein